MLRKIPGDDTSDRFPPFCFIANRTLAVHTTNPYLVILAAEIKFRRYLAANGPPLPPIYDSLMRKTIHVAELLYFQPVGLDCNFDAPTNLLVVDMEGHHAIGADDKSRGSTPPQQRRPASSDGGMGRKDADYWRYMLSGRGKF
jgi:hypothetical protein